jgi:hypothetical protein
MITTSNRYTQSQLDRMYAEFCAEMGAVMDSDTDRQDHATSGHLYADPGSDVHDHSSQP